MLFFRQICSRFLAYIWVSYVLKQHTLENAQLQDNRFVKGDVLLLNKPLEWTSFDVVNKLRRVLCRQLGVKKIKVGHAGTLDPLATGVVIICTGKKTKSIEEYQAQEKEYIAKVTLGATTPSYDCETEVNEEFPTEHITEESLLDCLTGFIGEIDQMPPVFSAISVDGKRAYKKARKGQPVDIKSRKVFIKEIEVLQTNFPEVELRVVCGKGTYIRSLAYDIGKALNSGGHLSGLERTRVGDFCIDDAFTVDAAVEWIQSVT